MMADRNMGFHHGNMMSSSPFNRHAISFQSGAINSSSGILSPDSGGFCDTFTALKPETGFALEWSPEEQVVLEEGLARYADETNIMKYIKIAASLQNKTVRDVALRCRWMNRKESGKRRKPDDYYAGKKIKDRKEKMIDPSSKPNMTPILQQNRTPYPYNLQHMENSFLSCDVMSTAMTQLLEENALYMRQISANLDMYNVQDNFDLLTRTRSNLDKILHEMSTMPGIMSQMPPLQVDISDELASYLFHTTSQTFLFSDQELQLKQELLL